jgi:hypothetical protein
LKPNDGRQLPKPRGKPEESEAEQAIPIAYRPTHMMVTMKWLAISPVPARIEDRTMAPESQEMTRDDRPKGEEISSICDWCKIHSSSIRLRETNS